MSLTEKITLHFDSPGANHKDYHIGKLIHWFMGLLLSMMLFNGFDVFAQRPTSVAGRIREIRNVSVSSVTKGVWLKGDLHVHSNHSKDNKASHTHPLSKIFTYADSVGMGFICSFVILGMTSLHATVGLPLILNQFNVDGEWHYTFRNILFSFLVLR